MSLNKQTLPIFLVSGVFWMMFALMSFLIFRNLTASPSVALPRVQADRSPVTEPPQSDPFFGDDPFEEMDKIHTRMMKNFGNFSLFQEWDDNFLKSPFNLPNSIGSRQSQYEVSQKETTDSLIYEIQLQNNVKGDSVDVRVENGMVTISGQTTSTNRDDSESCGTFFSSSSSFSRSFSVPGYVDSENVEITNKQNKIILTFPKWSQEV